MTNGHLQYAFLRMLLHMYMCYSMKIWIYSFSWNSFAKTYLYYSVFCSSLVGIGLSSMLTTHLMSLCTLPTETRNTSTVLEWHFGSKSILRSFLLDSFNQIIFFFLQQFLAGKLPCLPGELPTYNDWENHLTTIFPEVYHLCL